MTISSILFGVGLVLLAAFYISRPLRQDLSRSADGQQMSQRQNLLEQKAEIYAAIKEIDSDVQVGKLEPADHQTLRQRYLREGVALLKELDALPADDPVESAIEADLQRLRQGESPAVLVADYCPACGAPAGPGDKFCAKCGAQLEAG
jgi:hypothetical protein